MPPPQQQEDVELAPERTQDITFRTELGDDGEIVRREVGREERPRVIDGRVVPGNARYYDRRREELRAERERLAREQAGEATPADAAAAAGGAGRTSRPPATPSNSGRRTGGSRSTEGGRTRREALSPRRTGPVQRARRALGRAAEGAANELERRRVVRQRRGQRQFVPERRQGRAFRPGGRGRGRRRR